MKHVSDSITFKYRGLIGVICLVPIGLAIIFSSPLIAEDTFIDLAMDALGWMCFVTYVTFRVWATLYIGSRKDKELQTQGPYSITRNPLYWGTFCFILSISFFVESISLVVATMIVGAVYSYVVIPTEEKVLRRIFGEAFSKYERNTPRILPHLSHYQAPEFVIVNIGALKTEAKRLWRAATLPICIEFIMHLRTSPWWPHWFTFP